MTAAGQTIVITGASSGVGRAAAIALAGQGAEIAVVGRNPERTRAVAAETGGTAFIADFERLNDVRRLAQELSDSYAGIDVLANNAGGHIRQRRITEDGFEATVQSNYFAPFLLTELLLPRLSERRGRVISTASVANLIGKIKLDDVNFDHRAWLGGWPAYGTVKLMTIAYSRELARRAQASGVTAYSFHPGYVATRFGAESRLVAFAARLSPQPVGISAEAGAAPLVHLASTVDIDQPSGTYFDQFTPERRMRRQATDAELAGRLWRYSEQALARWNAPL